MVWPWQWVLAGFSNWRTIIGPAEDPGHLPKPERDPRILWMLGALVGFALVRRYA